MPPSLLRRDIEQQHWPLCSSQMLLSLPLTHPPSRIITSSAAFTLHLLAIRIMPWTFCKMQDQPAAFVERLNIRRDAYCKEIETVIVHLAEAFKHPLCLRSRSLTTRGRFVLYLSVCGYSFNTFGFFRAVAQPRPAMFPPSLSQ